VLRRDEKNEKVSRSVIIPIKATSIPEEFLLSEHLITTTMTMYLTAIKFPLTGERVHCKKEQFERISTVLLNNFNEIVVVIRSIRS
jgi:hypothetical protein